MSSTPRQTDHRSIEHLQLCISSQRRILVLHDRVHRNKLLQRRIATPPAIPVALPSLPAAQCSRGRSQPLLWCLDPRLATVAPRAYGGTRRCSIANHNLLMFSRPRSPPNISLTSLAMIPFSPVSLPAKRKSLSVCLHSTIYVRQLLRGPQALKLSTANQREAR